MYQNGFMEARDNKDGAEDSDNIEQVREILFGDQQRRTESQIEEINRRLSGLEEKIDQMAAEFRENLKTSEKNSATSQEDLVLRISNAIKTLGQEIEQLAAQRRGD